MSAYTTPRLALSSCSFIHFSKPVSVGVFRLGLVWGSVLQGIG